MRAPPKKVRLKPTTLVCFGLEGTPGEGRHGRYTTDPRVPIPRDES